MGLLNKKNTDNKPSTQALSESGSKLVNNDNKGVTALSAILFCFVLIAISISIAVQIINANNANQQHLASMQQKLGKNHLNQLNNTFSILQTVTDNASEQPSVMHALQAGDHAIRTYAEEQISAILPYAASVKIIPQGQAKLDTQASVPLTFAGLDMIKRLEKGKAVPLEIHKLNKVQYIQTIAAITNPNNQLLGSLLISFKNNALQDLYKSIDISAGQIAITQNFEKSEGRLVFQVGNGNQQGLSFKKASSVPHISFSYQLSENLLNHPLINQTQIILSGAIAILLALIGICIFVYVLNNKLNKNMHMLSEFTLSITGGRKPKMPAFTLGQFSTLAHALNQLTRRKGTDVVSNLIPSAPDSFENTTVSNNSSDSIHLDLDLDDELEDTYMESEDHRISRQIFRAYDIRGKIGNELTAEALELIGQAIGSEAYERGQQSLFVGHDGRLSSPELADALIAGIKSTGRDVIDIGLVATPVVYFAAYTQGTNSGVMITGSHNPPEYNGVKIVIDGEPLHEEGITHLYERIIENDLLEGEGSYQKQHLDSEYIDRIVSDIALAQPLKVVVDAGNGVAGQYAPKLLEAIGCDVTALYCDVDGTFPNHHPDPTIESNLQDLKACVLGDKADLGIAFDGDGDRVVIIDNEANIVQPDQLMMLFAKDVLNRCPGTDIVYDVKCSNKLGEYISQQGGRPIMWRSGHSLIKSKMLETGATLGGEMSGHIVFNERWYGFDDGLYAAARLLELLSADHRPVSEVFADFPLGIMTPEFHIETTDHLKFELISKLKEPLSSPAASLTEIDGIRVDFDNGWGLVRASNTTPTLTLRFEGNDQASLDMIKEHFKEAITTTDPSLQIPF